MLSVENAGGMPASFLQLPPCGSHQAEPAGGVTEEINEHYHAYVSLLPIIMEAGFRPSIGAGSDDLHVHVW